jgi:thiamine biosynthesis lipoprotein
VAALGTTATICVAAGERLDRAAALMERELTAVDEACSRFRPDSELARLNAAAGRPVAVGRRLLDAIVVALRVAFGTGGLVDPTVGRTLALAGYDRSFELVRARDARVFRARYSPVPGWRHVDVDVGRSTVRVPAGVELDLGATAKAAAADRIAHAAAAEVGGGVLVSLGGDVAVAGEPPDGGWSIRVADDHGAPLDAPGEDVSIRSGGLASSGTALRRWRAGEVELHHIVDPRTGRPARTPWRTVSVAARSCVDANAAATAAVVLAEWAPQWLASRLVPARLVAESGSVVRVGGWPEDAA